MLSAERAEARFVEVMLALDSGEAARRFRERRQALSASSHPEADIVDEAIDARIADADSALRSLLLRRSSVQSIDASGSSGSTLQALIRLKPLG